MADQQNAVQVAAQVLQLLDHDLPALAVEAAEPLVDNHTFNRPVLPAGVLADSQRQTNGDAELLTAAQERDVDRRPAGDAVERLQFERLFGRTLLVGDELQ